MHQEQLGNTLWKIADDLRRAINADDFREYDLSFLFLRSLPDNSGIAANKGMVKGYHKVKFGDRSVPLAICGTDNQKDIPAFERMVAGNKLRLVAMVDLAAHAATKLDTGELKALGLLLPLPGEQQRITDCLDDVIAVQTKKLAHFKTYAKGLVQQRFLALVEVEA